MEVKHAQYCTQKSSQASEGGGGGSKIWLGLKGERSETSGSHLFFLLKIKQSTRKIVYFIFRYYSIQVVVPKFPQNRYCFLHSS